MKNNLKILVLFFTLIIFFLSCGGKKTVTEEKVDLFPFENEQGKWGYINKECRIVI